MAVDLSTLFQSDPAAQELGLGFLGQEKQINAARLAHQQAQTQRDLSMLPFDIEAKRLGNEMTGAQIPGVKALSERQELDTRFSRETLGPKIEAEFKKFGGQISDAQLKEITNAGQAYSQAGSLLENIPGVATHASARQILGNFYRPEFDKVPPAALGRVIRFFGEEMINAQAKYMQQVGLAGIKTDSAERIAASRNEADIEKARIAAAAKIKAFDKDIMEAQAAAKAKYGSYPQRASYYLARAQEAAEAAAFADDQEAKRAFLARANYFGQIANEAQQMDAAKAAAAAQEANKRQPDLNTFGIPTVTPPGQAPAAQVPGNNPNVSPSTGSPAQERKGTTPRRKLSDQEYQGWFTKAKAANPGMSDAQIEQEAIKRGYK